MRDKPSPFLPFLPFLTLTRELRLAASLRRTLKGEIRRPSLLRRESEEGKRHVLYHDLHLVFEFANIAHVRGPRVPGGVRHLYEGCWKRKFCGRKLKKSSLLSHRIRGNCECNVLESETLRSNVAHTCHQKNNSLSRMMVSR